MMGLMEAPDWGFGLITEERVAVVCPSAGCTRIEVV
jgi:hypothetical protein